MAARRATTVRRGWQRQSGEGVDRCVSALNRPYSSASATTPAALAEMVEAPRSRATPASVIVDTYRWFGQQPVTRSMAAPFVPAAVQLPVIAHRLAVISRPFGPAVKPDPFGWDGVGQAGDDMYAASARRTRTSLPAWAAPSSINPAGASGFRQQRSHRQHHWLQSRPRSVA